MVLGLIHRQLIGQDPADLAELREGEAVTLELEAHGLDGGVAELGLAEQVEHGGRLALAVEEEAEGVDAVDGARHVLLLVDVRRLREENRRETPVNAISPKQTNYDQWQRCRRPIWIPRHLNPLTLHENPPPQKKQINLKESHQNTRRIARQELNKTYSCVIALSQWLMLSVCRKARPEAW